MYRIEVKPGEETVFRTIEELATGIRNGFITPRARIYHAASQKWLPIEFHPHYKKALDGNFTPTVSGPQASLAAMPAPTFSFPGATPAPQPAAAAAEPPVVVVPQPPAEPAASAARPRGRGESVPAEAAGTESVRAEIVASASGAPLSVAPESIAPQAEDPESVDPRSMHPERMASQGMPSSGARPKTASTSASVAPASVAPPSAAASVAAPPAPAPSPRVDPWHAAVARTAAESPVMAMQATVTRAAVSEPEPDSGPIERYSPVAVREPPRAALAPAPEVVLPNITYPELPPLEQLEHRPTARRSRRSAGRPLLLVGSAAVLVFAGQRLLASRGAEPGEPAPTAEAAAPADAPRQTSPDAPSAARASGSAAGRSTAVAPSRSQPLVRPPSQPMTPGPAFAASVPTRGTPGLAGAPTAIGSTGTPPAIASAPAAEPHAASRPDSAAIAPAPTAIRLDVPALLPGESIGPALDQARDSLALKRILKAVTGRKADPAAP
jgi:hypothetical protein